MKQRIRIVRGWFRLGGAILVGGALLGCGHDPNRGIDAAQAAEAARRVHTPPNPDVRAKMGPGHGG